MKTFLNLKAESKKGHSVTFDLEITHSMLGITHRFTATIKNASESIVWGNRPDAIYSDGSKLSNDKINNNSISFGTGELERQMTYPFVVYLAGSSQNKKDRMMFTLPTTKYELLKELAI